MTLRYSLDPVFAEINLLIEKSIITVNVKVNFILGEDYKVHHYLVTHCQYFLYFLLLLLGLNAAHSNFACICCDIRKDNRYVTLLRHACIIFCLRYDTSAATTKQTLASICKWC